MARRRTSLALRWLQTFAPPLALAGVAFAVDGAWHVLKWLVAR
jgi:hypothetical protein